MGVTVLTPDHSCLAGLTAPDFRASRARASLSWSWLGEDMFHWQPDSKFPCVAQEKGSKAKQQHEEKHTGIPQTSKFQIWRSLPNMEVARFSHGRVPVCVDFARLTCDQAWSQVIARSVMKALPSGISCLLSCVTNLKNRKWYACFCSLIQARGEA